MRTLRACLLVLACASGMCVSAQTGIRFIVPEYNKKFGKHNSFSLQYGVGVDRDLNDRLSFGVDFSFDLGLGMLLDDQEYGDDKVFVDQGAYTGRYYRNDRMIALTYRTAFALSDNDGFHAYIGSFIGVRNVKQTLHLAYWDGPSNGLSDNGPFTMNAEVSRTVVPIGLRFGFRSGLEGFFEDLYIQWGYCIGGGKSGFPQPYLTEADGAALSKFALTAGIALGVGW